MINLHRVRQLMKYGWLHAGQISEQDFLGKKRLSLFLDICGCFRKYGMWSNQYLKERFWVLDKKQRAVIGERYFKLNRKREAWVQDFYDNRKFLAKWSKYEIEGDAKMREKHGVELSRQHHLPGELKIGNYVRLCKDTFIDYSGGVELGDHVTLCYGTSIETHNHDWMELGKGRESSLPSSLTIGEGAVIGLHATILSSCNYIGKYARIGAGAVVTHDIPDYAMAVGIPARVKRFVNEER